MAPNSGPTKHRKAGSSLSGRPVVPAIPLPHVKRQAAAAANRSAKAKANPPATPIAPENVTRKKPEFKASDSLGKTTADSSSVERTSPKPLAEQTASRANQQTTTAQLDSTQVNAEGSKLGTSGPMASETSLLSTKDNTEVSVENNTDLTRLGASPEQTNGLPTMGEFRNGKPQILSNSSWNVTLF